MKEENNPRWMRARKARGEEEAGAEEGGKDKTELNLQCTFPHEAPEKEREVEERSKGDPKTPPEGTRRAARIKHGSHEEAD